MIEIEIKARVEDPKDMERSIIALGAEPIGIENQEDTYYNSQYRDLGKTDESLRIRIEDDQSFLVSTPKRMVLTKLPKFYSISIPQVMAS
jgi:predicted adenylyl cyclase CyaB